MVMASVTAPDESDGERGGYTATRTRQAPLGINRPEIRRTALRAARLQPLCKLLRRLPDIDLSLRAMHRTQIGLDHDAPGARGAPPEQPLQLESLDNGIRAAAETSLTAQAEVPAGNFAGDPRFAPCTLQR